MRWAWLLLFPWVAIEVPAPPAIAPGGVVNAASLMPSTLAGGAIARGARIRIPGVRLGPDTAVRGAESDPPLELAGVSVRFAQAGQFTAGRLFLVSESRIEAWIPDTVPLGAVELTVARQGLVSDPYRLTLVDSNPGFFTEATAPAPLADRIRNPEAPPGGSITLFGTGIRGPALDVFVGGVATNATVAAEADCCRGVERVEIRVPAGAPMGCAVPLLSAAASGGTANAMAAAIHPPGQPCHDAVDWFRGAVEQAGNAGYVVLARIQLDSSFVARYQVDYGIASFSRQESGQRVFPPLPPLGTCTAFTDRVNLHALARQARTPEEWTTIPQKTPGSRRLDAGQEITIAGPAGIRTLAPDPRNRETYNAILGGAPPFSRRPPLPDFLKPGMYTVTAAGGSDVGEFSAALDVPRVLVWKNEGAIRRIVRAKGVTVEWKAARRDSAILILAADADRFSGDSAMCLCMAPAAEGRFSVPPLPLGNIPPTVEENEISASYLLLMEMPADPPVRIGARGLDAAFAAFVSAAAKVVVYR